MKSIRIMNRNKRTIPFRERKRKIRNGQPVEFLNIKLKTNIAPTKIKWGTLDVLTFNTMVNDSDKIIITKCD